MPVVPRLTRQVGLDALPGVRLTAAETPEAEGAGVAEAQAQEGQALAGVGAKTAALGEEYFGKIEEEGRRQGDEIAVLNATKQLGQTRSDLDLKAKATRGADANGVPDMVEGEFNDSADKIGNALTNPTQKIAFAKVRQSMWMQLNDTVTTHVASQIQQYQGQELQAAVDNSRNFAGQNATNPVIIGQELQRTRSLIQTHARDLGFGPEETQKQIDAAVSAIHVDVLNNLIAQNQTKAAKTYFEEATGQASYGKRADGSEKGDGFFGTLARPDGNFSSELSIGVEIDGKETEIPALVPTLTDKEVNTLLSQSPSAKIPAAIVQKASDYAKARIAAGKSPFAGTGEADATLAPTVTRVNARPNQIAADQMPRLENALKQGEAQSEAIQRADKIIDSGGSLTSQLAQARAITANAPDDEHAARVRELVEQRIEHRNGVNEQIKRDQDEAAGDAGVKLLIASGGDLTSIPKTAWVSASGKQQEAWTTLAEHLSRGEAVQTNWQTWDVLDRLATSPDAEDRKKFAAMNLVPYKAQLADADMRHFLEVQGSVRKSDAPKTTALVATDAQTRAIVDGNLIAIGVNPNPPAPGNPKFVKLNSDRVVDYRRSVRDAVAAREATTGKKLTEPEMQDIADTLMAQTAAAKTHWFTPNEPAQFAFESGTSQLTNAADVPSSERVLIESALQKAGYPVTDAAVLSLFNQHLQIVRGKK